MAVEVLQGMLLCGIGSRLMMFGYRDGSLTPSGFLVCGFLVATLAVMRHYVLVGDLHQGLHFVQWRAERKTFALLSRHPGAASAYACELMLDEPSLHLLLSEEGGRLRAFSYSRQLPESRGGTFLVPHAALQLGAQATTMLRVRLGPSRTAVFVTTSGGGIGVLSPLDEASFRRLSFLQQKLVGGVQHTAGLNPRAYRAHHAGAISSRELKRVLDGTLLRRFATLDAAVQDKLAHQIGTTPRQLHVDLATLSGDAVRSLTNT